VTAASKIPTVAFATLGCKLNVFESNALGEGFRARRYRVVPFESRADIYVINTCTVTARSDHKSRQLIRRIQKRAPASRIIVTGCYAERDAETLAALPGVDLVVGNRRKLDLPRLLEQALPPATVVMEEGGRDHSFPDEPLTRFGEYTRAFLKVQDGCDYRCTFCVVHQVRGPSRSLPMERAVEQARQLARAGHKEISLTGVDPGAWGRDLPARPRLAVLVEALCEIPELGRIRLSSVGAQDYDDHLIELVATHPKLARHVHLPVQSGSDDILRRMQRGARRAEIDRVVDRLYALDSSLRFGGDFMVGFPGEGRDDFMETVRMITEGPWSYGHVFPFSPRPGTPAAAMRGGLSDAERTARAAELRTLVREKNVRYRSLWVGRTTDVLVENRREAASGYSLGLSSRYVLISFPRRSGLDEGQIVSVRIHAVEEERTVGELC
jgi:threonylcarbamoyladenosine tRNA methylthiotransferase MtaB